MALGVSLTQSNEIPVPKDLEGAIREAKGALESHLSKRPSNRDIPALTRWVESRDLLKGRLEFLEGCVRLQWRDVPIPGQEIPGAVSVPPAGAPDPIKPRLTRKARKTPAEKLAGMLRKQEQLFQAIRAAETRKTAAALRQQVFCLRTDIKALCKLGNLPVPELSAIPNPWNPEAM